MLASRNADVMIPVNIPAILEQTPLSLLSINPLKIAGYISIFSLGVLGLSAKYQQITACIDIDTCARPLSDISSREFMLGLMFTSQITLDTLASAYKTVSTINSIERYFPRQKNKLAAYASLSALSAISGLSYLTAFQGVYGLSYLSRNPTYGLLIAAYVLNDLQDSLYGTTKLLEIDLPPLNYQLQKIIRSISHPQFERMLINVGNMWRAIISNEAHNLNPAQLSVDPYLLHSRATTSYACREILMHEIGDVLGTAAAGLLAYPRIYAISTLFQYAAIPPISSIFMAAYAAQPAVMSIATWLKMTILTVCLSNLVLMRTKT